MTTAGYDLVERREAHVVQPGDEDTIKLLAKITRSIDDDEVLIKVRKNGAKEECAFLTDLTDEDLEEFFHDWEMLWLPSVNNNVEMSPAMQILANLEPFSMRYTWPSGRGSTTSAQVKHLKASRPEKGRSKSQASGYRNRESRSDRIIGSQSSPLRKQNFRDREANATDNFGAEVKPIRKQGKKQSQRIEEQQLLVKKAKDNRLGRGSLPRQRAKSSSGGSQGLEEQQLQVQVPKSSDTQLRIGTFPRERSKSVSSGRIKSRSFRPQRETSPLFSDWVQDELDLNLMGAPKPAIKRRGKSPGRPNVGRKPQIGEWQPKHETTRKKSLSIDQTTRTEPAFMSGSPNLDSSFTPAKEIQRQKPSGSAAEMNSMPFGDLQTFLKEEISRGNQAILEQLEKRLMENNAANEERLNLINDTLFNKDGSVVKDNLDANVPDDPPASKTQTESEDVASSCICHRYNLFNKSHRCPHGDLPQFSRTSDGDIKMPNLPPRCSRLEDDARYFWLFERPKQKPVPAPRK